MRCEKDGNTPSPISACTGSGDGGRGGERETGVEEVSAGTVSLSYVSASANGEPFPFLEAGAEMDVL